MGLRPENVTLTDIKGVVRADRAEMLPNMARYARDTNANGLEDALQGADIFIGLSAPRVLKPEWLQLLADKPMILALANPDPEIDPGAGADRTARTPSSPPAAATIPTRSTTFCVSRSSSVARWTSGPPRSTRR